MGETADSVEARGPRAVTFNAELGRYEMSTEAGTAFANVHRAGDRLIFTHTEVPYALRGRGAGARLVKGALDDVRRQGLKAVPRCWFVAEFIQRNPAYRDVVA